jgi:dihydroorotate dehydrogenase
MEAHTASALLQEKACGALKKLAVNDDNEVKIAAAGGIETLATAMETHQGSALLQQHACLALHSLAINARLRERIKAAGGVELAKRAVSASDATERTKKYGEALIEKLA